jgi:hypothetical protein
LPPEEEPVSDEIKWDPAATAILEAIASDIPFIIRSTARSAAIAQAERHARDGNKDTITRDDAIIAMILITPANMRDAFRELLKKRNVDPEPFEKYFEPS